MIHVLIDFCHQFLQVSNMYTATSNEQSFTGTFIFIREDPEEHVCVCGQFFCMHLCCRTARSNGNMLTFDKITALQSVNACSLEIYVLSLEKALIFLLTFEHSVLT